MIGTGDTKPGASRRQAGWALAVLTAIISINYLDRNVISIFLDSIKKDLELSDTVMGLVTGFSSP